MNTSCPNCATFLSSTPIVNATCGSCEGGARMPACAHTAAVPDELVRESQNIIKHAFEAYPENKIGVAFNGGKDCVVMMHLLVRTMGVERLRQCRIFVIDEVDEFAELMDFRERFIESYVPGATLEHFSASSSMREALWEVKKKYDIDAAFLGTRRSDPVGTYQASAVEPTTQGWPPMIRLCPVFDWPYKYIWQYILHEQVLFCALYAEGYTSLGKTGRTIPHRELLQENGIYAPAWMLSDPESERAARM